MPLGRYRIKQPTTAPFQEDGRHVAHMVPAGAFITVDSDTFDGNKLVDVIWDDRKAMMFTQDLSQEPNQTCCDPASAFPS